jgi:peptide/nickel transport system substrate-binding protein
LRIVSSSDIDHLDPAEMYSSVSWFLARGLYRTLTTYPDPGSRGGALVGDLGTDTGEPNVDASEWTYHLRAGVEFGPGIGGAAVPGVTGTQITCDDFKYAFERLFTPSVGAGYSFYYEVLQGADAFRTGAASDLTGITCPDPETIVFHLLAPTPDWPYRVSMPATTPVPRSLAAPYDQGPRTRYDSHAVFTGPYILESRDPAHHIVLRRNPQWVRTTDEARAALVDRVEWKLSVPSATGLTQVLNDREDLALDMPVKGTMLERVASDPQLLPRLVNESEGCTRYIFLNTQVAPFDNALVRRAVNVAIDRANLKRIFGGPGTGPIATSVIPPGLTGHLSAASYNPFASPAEAGDIKKARRMMARAGYPEGYDGAIRVVGAANPPLSRVFDSVVLDLKRLGFSHLVLLQPPPSDEFGKYYARPGSETAVGTSAGWCKDYPQPYSFVWPVLSRDGIDPTNSRNYAQLDDPALEGAIQRAAGELDPQAAAASWRTVDRIATESGAWVPWSWDESSILVSSRVRDARFLPFLGQIDWVNTTVVGAGES